MVTDCGIVVTRSAVVAAFRRPRPWAAAERTNPTAKRGKAMGASDDFALLDDSALLTWRVEVRAELERLAPHSPDHAQLAAQYDLSTQEIDDRARKAWSRGH